MFWFFPRLSLLTITVFVFLLLSLNVCCAWNEVLRGDKTKAARGTESEDRGKDSTVKANRFGGKNIRLRALQTGNSEKIDCPFPSFWFCLTLQFSSSISFSSPIFLCLYVVPSSPHARQRLKRHAVRLSQRKTKM